MPNFKHIFEFESEILTFLEMQTQQTGILLEIVFIFLLITSDKMELALH